MNFEGSFFIVKISKINEHDLKSKKFIKIFRIRT